jgi:hypothetical protein
MKKLLIALAILAGTVAAVVALVFYLTGGVTRAGDRFLTLVREGKVHEAYLATAKAFRTATPEEGFVSFLRSTGLADNREAKWSSRSLSGDTGELEGSVRTRDGGTVPVKLRLVKEESEWRVLAVERVAAGVIATASPGPLAATPGVPPEADLQAMATDAVLRLGQAIAAKDFTAFHGSTAKLWQRQTTPEALRDAFRPLSDQGADLSVVQGKIPEFTGKPSIDGSGRLILEGFFPTEPTRVAFTLKYIHEAPDWKLIGVNVRLEAAPALTTSSPPTMPSPGDLAALTHRSMRLFAAAVARDDFSELHSAIAGAWKRQMSESELRNTFKTFVDKKVPLTVVETSQPVFTEKPSIDSDGILSATGHYPTKPVRVAFTLRFLNEESQWRLAGIEVSTKEE